MQIVVKRVLRDDGDYNVNSVKKELEELKSQATVQMAAERQCWQSQLEE